MSVRMNRSQKETFVAELQGELLQARNVVLLGFTGLKVAEVDELRRKMREARTSYRVVKNTLALRALEGTGLEFLKEHFQGAVAIAYNPDAPVELAKLLTGFAGEHAALQVRVAVVDGTLVPAKELKSIATLPTATELRGRLAGLLASPLRRLVGTLAASPRALVVVLSEGAKKRGAEADAAGGGDAPTPEAGA